MSRLNEGKSYKASRLLGAMALVIVASAGLAGCESQEEKAEKLAVEARKEQVKKDILAEQSYFKFGPPVEIENYQTEYMARFLLSPYHINDPRGIDFHMQGQPFIVTHCLAENLKGISYSKAEFSIKSGSMVLLPAGRYVQFPLYRYNDVFNGNKTKILPAGMYVGIKSLDTDAMRAKWEAGSALTFQGASVGTTKHQVAKVTGKINGLYLILRVARENDCAESNRRADREGRGNFIPCAEAWGPEAYIVRIY